MIVPIYHFKQQENTRIQGCKSGWGSFYPSIPHAAKYRVDFSTDLSKPQKLLLISQLYSNQLKGQFTIKHRDRKITLVGEVRELSRKEISIKTSEGYRLVQLDNILQIQLLENHIH